MEFLIGELLKRIPKLSATNQKTDPMVWGKFFAPDAHWAWYILKGEEVGEHTLFFGWAIGCAEPHGRFVCSDLTSIHGYYGFHIEPDPHFTPQLLSQIYKAALQNR